MRRAFHVFSLSLATLVGCASSMTAPADASSDHPSPRDSASDTSVGVDRVLTDSSNDMTSADDVSASDDATRGDVSAVLDATTSDDASTPPDDVFTGRDVVTGSDVFVAMPGAVVGIQNGALIRGTDPFRPRGLTLTGLALSPAAAAANPTAVYSRAQQQIVTSYDATLARYASWSVDTLRFQVSQDGLDPMSPVYDPNYLPFIIATVEHARDAGFVVIISMRESMPGNFVDQCGPDKLPCAITHRAWRQILAHPADIGHDRRFLLEIYNEPMGGVDNTDANWMLWRPPHQSLLDDIRTNMSAVNVVIADGIRAGKFLPIAQSYRLSDPVGRLAYGVHPYPLYLSSISYYRTRDWQPAFADFCDSGVACIATEWATGNDTACLDATNNPNMVSSPNVATSLLRFLHVHNIGSCVWPGDYPASIVSDWSGTLTTWGTWTDFSCSDASQHHGMGAMIRAYYTTGTPP